MKPSYRIAELEKIVDAFRQRAFEAERERDEYKHRCKVYDGVCAIAEQQRDHWMQRAKAAESDEMKGSLKAAFVNAETWMKRALKAERERDEFTALAEEQSKLAGRNAARAKKAEAEIARRDAAASKPVAWISERNLKILGKAFSVVVKHEPVMVRPVALYTTPPAASVPDGWKLVPIKPTWSMLSADGCSKHHNGQECSHHENRKRIWSAMLAAAPAPGGEQ